MVDVGSFHIPLGPLMIVDGVFNMNVNQVIEMDFSMVIFIEVKWLF